MKKCTRGLSSMYDILNGTSVLAFNHCQQRSNVYERLLVISKWQYISILNENDGYQI